MTDEQYRQAQQDLADMFRTPGWSTTKALLRANLRAIETRVAADWRLVGAELERERIKWALFKELIEQPMEVLLGSLKSNVVIEDEE